MLRIRLMSIVLAAALCLTPQLPAQAAAEDLVDLVPPDFGLCLVVRDLRSQHDRLLKSGWFAALRATALGEAVFSSADVTKLLRTEAELQKVLGVDWATFRDDVLGDEVALAYRPASADSEEEGLLLLRARRPELLARLIERLNDIQRANGELRSLVSVKYKDTVYHKRDDRGKQLFYLLDGPLLAVAARESMLPALIDRRQQAGETSVWRRRFTKAGAERAFVTLAANPRVLHPPQRSSDSLPPYWQALEAIFVILQPAEAVEIRLNVQASPEQLPSWLRSALLEAPAPSAAWQHFPTDAILTLAGRTNFADTLATVTEMTPPAKRAHLSDAAQRSVGAVTGLDFFKDILPNVGPDWGICILPPSAADPLPLGLIALAVRPGGGAVAVDQALLRSLQLFAGLAVLDYNKNHPDAMRQQTTVQDKIEVRYLESAKLFPPGLQPAYALKDGYLLLASSPQAILRFRAGSAAAPQGDTPLLRLSTRSLAEVLRQRREQVAAKLVHKQHLSAAQAQQQLARFLEVLDLFERVEISGRPATGHADWVLRIYPATGERGALAP